MSFADDLLTCNWDDLITTWITTAAIVAYVSRGPAMA